MVKEKYETPHVSVVNTEKIGSLLMVSAPCRCDSESAFLACPSDGSETGWHFYPGCDGDEMIYDYYGRPESCENDCATDTYWTEC